jgi:hypothetical protein
MRERCSQFGRIVMPEGNRASAFFLSRGWRKEAERAEFLEGKIKARSRKRPQVIVCTSFFGETYFCIPGNSEIITPEAMLFCGFDLSLGYSALPLACMP